MKLFLIFLTLCTLTLSVYFTFTRYERRNTSVIRTSNGSEEREVSSRGKIRFNENETLIESVSRNGFLKYRNNTIKLKATANEQGGVVYQLSEDGTRLNINDKYGRQVLAEVIREILELGFDARGRLERLYAKSGKQGVLDAIEKLKPDYLKAMYLDYLLTTANLSNEDILHIIKKAGTLSADYEKSKILNTLATHLKDSSASQAYLDVVKSIDADFEKTKVLESIIRQPLDSIQFGEVLKIVGEMNSDFEKSNLLKKIINSSTLQADRSVRVLSVIRNVDADYEKAKLLDNFSTHLSDSLTAQAYLEVVKSMTSDFEQVKVLENIIRQPVNTPVLNEIISITGSLDADHEKANLLKKIMERTKFENGSFDRILSVIHNINGEFEKVNLIKNLAEKDLNSDEEWIGLLDEVGQVDADFEKAGLLTHLAAKMPRNDNVRAAYVKAAKTINSEMDYGKALRAAD